MQFRQNPAVNLWAFVQRNVGLTVIKAVYIGVESKERIGVIERSEEFSAYFVNTFGIEFQVVPRLRVGKHVHANRVGTIFLHHFKGVHHVAHVLAHLISFGIEHQSRRDNVLESYTIEHHCCDGVQRKEPTTRLVNAFVNEVGRECDAFVDEFGILEGVMHLCIGHRARIEPHVNEVYFAFHGLSCLTY